MKRPRGPSPRRARGASRALLALAPWITVILIAGCAAQANNYQLGVQAMQRGRVDEALLWLERAVVYDPGNAPAHRDYGTALYLNGNSSGALRELEQARDLGLHDGTTAFYLGLAYETSGRREEAIGAYAEFVELGEVDELRRPVRARLRKLTRELIQEEVAAALAADTAGEIGGGEVPDIDAIAVLPFHSLLDDTELEAMRTGLAALVAEDLDRIETLRVVDRLRIAAIRESLDLEPGTMIDSLGAQRTGRLVGAGRIVTGGLNSVVDDRLEVEGAIANVATGLLQWTEPVDDELDRFYSAQKRLTFAILEAMGITPTPEIRQAIESSVPTQSLLALLAYSRGLEFEDRGLRADARAAFQQAIGFDPAFRQALEGLERLGLDDAIDDDSIMTPDELAEQDYTIRSRRGLLGQESGASPAAQSASAGAAGDEAPETAADQAPPPDDGGSALDDILGSADAGGVAGAGSRLTRSSGAAQTGQTAYGDNDTREPTGEAQGASGIQGAGESIVDLEVDIPN